MTIQEVIDYYTDRDVALAFSGGVDSTLLLKLLCEQSKKKGTHVYAYTIHTMLHPMRELEESIQLANQMGAIHRIIQVDELKEAGIEMNPVNRCYLCKKTMFSKVLEDVKKQQIPYLLEGTNMDDTHEYRPGIRALKELGVKSPFVEAGLTKAEIRTLAKSLDLSVSTKPSSPCMATRLPYGTRLKKEQLDGIMDMEAKIRDLGFYNVRTRIHDSLVRVELDEKDLIRAIEQKEKIIAIIKSHDYDYVSLDLEGFRSGSQDLHIKEG